MGTKVKMKGKRNDYKKGIRFDSKEYRNLFEIHDIFFNKYFIIHITP